MHISIQKIPHYISYPLVVLVLLVTLGMIQVIETRRASTNNAPPVTPAPQVLPSEGTVAVGETLALEGMSVTLHSIVADYRCPADAVCIEAGAIVAYVTLDNGVLRETFNMPSDEVPRPFGTHRISIIDVAPLLLSTVPADPDAYRVTFRTEPMTETEQAESYFRATISTLSPEPAVLGGTFYVTEVAFPEVGRAVVSYEDGHIALVADVAYEVRSGGVVDVRSFIVRSDEPAIEQPPLPPAPGIGERICEDFCGNGTCEEIVCMGSGCPCAESPDSCPQDCAPSL